MYLGASYPAFGQDDQRRPLVRHSLTEHLQHLPRRLSLRTVTIAHRQQARLREKVSFLGTDHDLSLKFAL